MRSLEESLGIKGFTQGRWEVPGLLPILGLNGRTERLLCSGRRESGVTAAPALMTFR